jgi:hypothetical protein
MEMEECAAGAVFSAIARIIDPWIQVGLRNEKAKAC